MMQRWPSRPSAGRTAHQTVIWSRRTAGTGLLVVALVLASLAVAVFRAGGGGSVAAASQPTDTSAVAGVPGVTCIYPPTVVHEPGGSPTPYPRKVLGSRPSVPVPPPTAIPSTPPTLTPVSSASVTPTPVGPPATSAGPAQPTPSATVPSAASPTASPAGTTGTTLPPCDSPVHYDRMSRVTAPPTGGAAPAALRTEQAGFQYHAGGRIETDPRVYLIFWGNGWSTDPSGVRSAEISLFQTLSGTGYNRILSQYNDLPPGPVAVGNYIHNDVSLAGTWIDSAGPSRAIDGSLMAAEAQRAEASNGWTHDPNAQYIMLPQANSPYSGTGYCAYHLYQSGYVMDLIPYLGDTAFAGCIGTNHYGPTQLAATTVVTSHEYAEAATDPFVNAWWYINPADPSKTQWEIGDLCNPFYTGVGEYVALPSTNIYVQPLWSLASETCVSSADSGPKVSRHQDIDRVLSSIKYSVASWPSGSAQYVVLARSTEPGWADGVPAADLAQDAGPLLWADSAGCTSSDYSAMLTEIKRVLPPGAGGTYGGRVYIVGGITGVPQCVETALTGLGIYNQRVQGSDRCDSSVNVAALITPYSIMNVVSGDSFPDGESMAAVPGPAGNIATLVTPSSGVVGQPVSALCSSADVALQSFGNRGRSNSFTPIVRIAGGTAAVSAAVEAEINRDVCPATLNCTRRYGGSDRYGTSLLIAQNLVTNPFDFTAATGTDWADGVAGGLLAWQAGSPVLLFDAGATSAGADVTSNARYASSGYVLGGTTVEPASTMASFAALFPAAPIGGQIISNVDAGVCVDDSGSGTGNGNSIQIWGCNGTAAQAWRLYSNGELVVLGGCMTAAGTGWWGSKIQYGTCTGSSTQTWTVGSHGELVNAAYGLCLDDPSSNTNWTTQLQVWGCNQTAAQNWTLP